MKLISYLWAVSLPRLTGADLFYAFFFLAAIFVIKYVIPLRINAAIAGMETTVTTTIWAAQTG